MQTSRLSYLIDTATKVFDVKPHRDIALPTLLTKLGSTITSFEAPALWTKDKSPRPLEQLSGCCWRFKF